MRRPAFALLCAASALAIGIPASIGLTAVSADDQASRPLSQVPKVERFGQASLDAQAAFLKRMPNTQFRYGENGAISWLQGRTGIVLPSGLAQFQVGQPSKELLDRVGPALLAAGTEELRVTAIAHQAGKADLAERQSSPERAVNFVQYIRGREVQDSSVNIVVNQQTNEVTLVVANFLPDRGLPREPKLTAVEARAKVEAAMRSAGLDHSERVTFQDYPASLAYTFEEIGDNGGVGGALVWVFQVLRNGLPAEANVNALTGEVVRLRSFITGYAPNRQSYTASGTFLTPPNGMTFMFGEAGPPPGTGVVPTEAYNKAGLAFLSFDAVFGRNSWDGAGASIQLVTNYGNQLGNAYYGPGGWLMFANAQPGQLSAAEDLDAVTHEYTHGIVQNRLGIINIDGPVDGAPSLNEGFADWGATVPNVHFQGFPSPSTWQIGHQNPSNPLDGLRNLQFPIAEDLLAVDWYPSRTQFRSRASLYRNAMVMGHAFYLLATGGQHYRAGLPGSAVPVIPVTGLGYETARNIFYYSMFTGVLNNTSTFFSLRDATMAAALPTQQTSVSQAWQAVGLSHGCSSAPATPQIQVWPDFCRGRHKITWNDVAGAVTYNAEATPVLLGWAFGQTIVDSDINECGQNIPANTGDWWVRVRACNGCGCSGWSPQGLMEYWWSCQ